MILQNNDFFDLWSAHRYPLIELFHLSSLLQIPNDGKMVSIESFGNFSCCKRINFDGALSWLSISDGRPLCSSSSRLLSPLQNFWPTTALYVHQEFLGQIRCWCCELSLLLYNPFWPKIRRLFKFSFCLTSFPQSKININSRFIRASLIAQLVKNLPATQEAPVWFLDGEDPLEKE